MVSLENDGHFLYKVPWLENDGPFFLKVAIFLGIYVMLSFMGVYIQFMLAVWVVSVASPPKTTERSFLPKK